MITEENNINKCYEICKEYKSDYEKYLQCLKRVNEKLKAEVEAEGLKLANENLRLERELEGLKNQRAKGRDCPSSPHEKEVSLCSQLFSKIKNGVEGMLINNDDNRLQAQVEVPPKR